MLFDAPLAQRFAARLYELGVLVTGFFYPVVPMGQARVRVQLSAAHSTAQLDRALAAFAQAGAELGLLNQAGGQLMERILVIGANGQIGSELVSALGAQHGAQNVIATDIGAKNLYAAARYEQLDVLDQARLARLVADNGITQVYQLAAMLSATGERAPLKAWKLNMNGLLNILEMARARLQAGQPLRVFWPSSIAVFGPEHAGDRYAANHGDGPDTMYGISKLAGERLCEYYFRHYGVDVRSIRYPGVISYKSPPGGGTTDYAIAMLHAASAARITSASWDRIPRCR